MSAFAIFDASGFVVQMFDAFDATPIPNTAVAIEHDDRDRIVGAPGRWRWDGSALVAYTPPPAPVPVPASVTNFQARAALIDAGLFDKADAAVRASGDARAVQAWDYANNFYRASALIDAIGGALGLTAARTDDLFRAAELIET